MDANVPTGTVADCLMANHPEAREHDVSHDEEEGDPHNPISSAARSPATSAAESATTVAAPAASVSAVPAVSAISTVSAVSTVSAPNTASAVMHHDEIVRVPGRGGAGPTCEFPENGHGRMQTARALAL